MDAAAARTKQAARDAAYALDGLAALGKQLQVKMPAPVPNPMKKPNSSMQSNEQYFCRIWRFRQ